MTISSTEIQPYITNNEALVGKLELSSHPASVTQTSSPISVAASASGQVIPLTDKSVQAILLAVDNGVSTLTATVTIGETSQVFKVNELLTLCSPGISALTVSNSDPDNAVLLYTTIVTQ